MKQVRDQDPLRTLKIATIMHSSDNIPCGKTDDRVKLQGLTKKVA